MSLTTTECLTEALTLPHEARSLIARCLLQSLEDDTDGISPEWREEIRRRREEHLAGRGGSTPAGQMFADLRSELRRGRP